MIKSWTRVELLDQFKLDLVSLKRLEQTTELKA